MGQLIAPTGFWPLGQNWPASKKSLNVSWNWDKQLSIGDIRSKWWNIRVEKRLYILNCTNHKLTLRGVVCLIELSSLAKVTSRRMMTGHYYFLNFQPWLCISRALVGSLNLGYLKRIIVLLKTSPKYRKLDYNKNKKSPKNHAYACRVCSSWYNGS